jgi:hypothetical protein
MHVVPWSLDVRGGEACRFENVREPRDDALGTGAGGVERVGGRESRVGDDDGLASLVVACRDER